MLGARTFRPHSMQSRLKPSWIAIVGDKQGFALRAQCGRDVRAPSNRLNLIPHSYDCVSRLKAVKVVIPVFGAGDPGDAEAEHLKDLAINPH